MKKPGRPRGRNNRDVIIGVRFTPHEARLINKARDLDGKGLSDWVRDLLIYAASITRARHEKLGKVVE